MNAAEDRERRGDVVVADVQRKGTAVDRTVPLRMCAQRLQFRAEEEYFADPAVVQRLLAHAVSREIQASCVPVPERDCEHPGHLGEGGREAPVTYPGQNYLRVRMATPRRRRAESIQISADFCKVVDLAVEGDHIPAARRAHRLMSCWRKIQNRKPAVTQPDTQVGVEPKAEIVWAAVPQCGGHRAQDLFLHPIWLVKSCIARYAAHR